MVDILSGVLGMLLDMVLGPLPSSFAYPFQDSQ